MRLHRNEKFYKWGLTAFFVIVAGILFWIVFSNFPGFYQVILDLIGILAPILYGCFFAYVMNPIMEFISKHTAKLLSKTGLREKKVASISKGLGVFCSLLVLLSVIYALIALIVPNVIESASDLLSKENLDRYYSEIMSWTHDTFEDTAMESWFNEILAAVLEQLKTLDFYGIVADIFSAGVSVVRTVSNLVIGLIASIYILVYKKQLCAQAKKITICLFRSDRADRIFEIARRTNRIFSGYVIGKILDAILVGVITYIVLSIIGLPYAVLIATLVGTTNVIPYFGPFIGGIPSALLLLIENPLYALYFVIFIVILQMIDGNIIENRIMGLQLGISDFWVLVAILLFGGVFGFAGMLLGVPIFAVIYSLISDAVNKKLRSKRYPVDTELYYTLQTVHDLPVTVETRVTYVSAEPSYDLNIEPEDENADEFD